ncbi:MAG: sensor domain-containing protein [Mycobacterium sp.]
MTIFISHSSRDHAAVRLLAQNLQTANESVWLDQSLIGGDAWWQRILHQIRSCTVFIVALSNSCLQSKPCRAEIDYAKSLGLPILPVLIGDVDSYRIDPIFAVQSVDFRNPDVASGAALIAAVRGRAAERKDLPDPLPEPPPVPYEYLQRLGVAIDSPEELSPTEQATILTDLRQALRTEDDESVRADIHRLLSALRRRSEVTHATVEEIDDLLRRHPAVGAHAATLVASESTAGSAAENLSPQANSPGHLVGHPAPAAATTESTKPPSPINPKTVAIAGGAIVVIAVIAVVAFLLVGRSSQGSTANNAATTTSLPPPPVAVAALDGLLPSPDQVNTAMGATTMKLGKQFTALSDSSPHIADNDCLVMNFPAQAQVYAGSGWSAVHGQEFADGANIAEDKYLAAQYLVLFPSAGQAASFFTASSQRWPACSNRQYTYTDPQGVWDVGPVSNTNGTLSVMRTQENVGGWACQRALTVRNNVAIDIQTCSYNPADAAVNIAGQIAGKVPNK